MYFRIERAGLECDPWLRAFVKSTIAFAVWHSRPKVGRIDARLERTFDGQKDALFRCELRAEKLDGGSASATATADEICLAVQEAADRLEVALYGPLCDAPPIAPNYLAA